MYFIVQLFATLCALYILALIAKAGSDILVIAMKQWRYGFKWANEEDATGPMRWIAPILPFVIGLVLILFGAAVSIWLLTLLF